MLKNNHLKCLFCVMTLTLLGSGCFKETFDKGGSPASPKTGQVGETSSALNSSDGALVMDPGASSNSGLTPDFGQSPTVTATASSSDTALSTPTPSETASSSPSNTKSIAAGIGGAAVGAVAGAAIGAAAGAAVGAIGGAAATGVAVLGATALSNALKDGRPLVFLAYQEMSLPDSQKELVVEATVIKVRPGTTTKLTKDHITVSNGKVVTVTDISDNVGSKIYDLRISPTAAGEVVVKIPENSIYNSAGKGNIASNEQKITYPVPTPSE